MNVQIHVYKVTGEWHSSATVKLDYEFPFEAIGRLERDIGEAQTIPGLTHGELDYVVHLVPINRNGEPIFTLSKVYPANHFVWGD